jgi:hypothetical protein
MLKRSTVAAKTRMPRSRTIQWRGLKPLAPAVPPVATKRTLDTISRTATIMMTSPK